MYIFIPTDPYFTIAAIQDPNIYILGSGKVLSLSSDIGLSVECTTEIASEDKLWQKYFLYSSHLFGI